MLPTRSSGRKRWNIHDGPRGSLRRLRNQLAEDGCAESQVVLAKQLLDEECVLEADRVANFKQAIEWLICATEQGHEEARKLLRRCVRSGVISENNATVVRAKSCLKASRQENAARKAARDLFASISNGEEYITVAQLERRIREICDVTLRKAAEESERSGDESPDEQDQDRRSLQPHGDVTGDSIVQNGSVGPSPLAEAGYDTEDSSDSESRNLTVENLVTAAVNYCHGELPLTGYGLTLTEPSKTALDHIPKLHQAFLHPILFIKVLYLKLLFYFSQFSLRLSNFEVALLLLGYFFFASESASDFGPLLVFYTSLITMVVSTFKMLNAKREFVDFRKWSGLFLRYSDGGLDVDESENLFVRNNLRPFLHFFVALLANLLIFPLVTEQWVAFSEISIMSFLLMFLTLFSFSFDYNRLPDVLALVSFSINVLAKYPYEKDAVVNRGWRFLDFYIQTYPSYVLGNSIEFCLNSRVFFSLLIPVILFLMAKRNNFNGFVRYAIPHLVTLSWMQIFIVASQGCTMYGLIRGTLGLVCLFLFLPIMGLVTLFLPIFACLQTITLSEIFYGLAILSCLMATLMVTCVLAKLESTKDYITPIQLLIGVIAFLYLSSGLLQKIEDGLSGEILNYVDKKATLQNYFKHDYHYDYPENVFMDWEEYYSNCHTPSWIEANVARAQIKCAVLEGMHVNWQGSVVDVSLKSVKNNWNYFASMLPGFLREYFKCYYGEEYASLCHGEDAKIGTECHFIRKMAKRTGKTCHLNNYDAYTFEVSVRLETGALLKKHSEINLTLDHYFSNITRKLRVDDKIRFKAVLLNPRGDYSIGGRKPNLQVYEIACSDCKNSDIQDSVLNSKLPMTRFEKIGEAVFSDLIVSGKYVLNLILNPVVVLK